MHNNNHIEKFLLKVKSKNTVVGIVGLGYVGLPLGLRFVEEGFQTIGFDLDNKKVDSINNGKSYIDHISDDKILTAKKNGFKATVDYKNISKVDAIIICVPTPLGVHNEPDLSYIYGTLNLLKPYLKHGQLLVLESTTYPGTTEEELLPKIQNKGLNVGKDFFLIYF